MYPFMILVPNRNTTFCSIRQHNTAKISVLFFHYHYQPYTNALSTDHRKQGCRSLLKNGDVFGEHCSPYLDLTHPQKSLFRLQLYFIIMVRNSVRSCTFGTQSCGTPELLKVRQSVLRPSIDRWALCNKTVGLQPQKDSVLYACWVSGCLTTGAMYNFAQRQIEPCGLFSGLKSKLGNIGTFWSSKWVEIEILKNCGRILYI